MSPRSDAEGKGVHFCSFPSNLWGWLYASLLAIPQHRGTSRIAAAPPPKQQVPIPTATCIVSLQGIAAMKPARFLTRITPDPPRKSIVLLDGDLGAISGGDFVTFQHKNAPTIGQLLRLDEGRPGWTQLRLCRDVDRNEVPAPDDEYVWDCR